MPNISSKRPKIAFWEDFSFQIYHSFHSQFKQNGLPIISSINTNFCGILVGVEDQVWNLEKGGKFLSATYGQSMPRGRTVRASPRVRVAHAEL
jgi:hypothetical protein